MRFTPELLRKHARVLVEKETKRHRIIRAAYLKGSLLYGSPLLGGAGDIDLVFIQNSPPVISNRIQWLTPEIHFDIEYHDQSLYRKPREIRVDPWLGPTLHDAQPLHDPRHLLDYTQAGVRSNFYFPENIQSRARPLIESARQFWLDRQVSPHQEVITEMPAFLEALQCAVNSVALLNGPPLPTRRLGRDFPERAQAAGAPGLTLAFAHLLGAVSVDKNQLRSWMQSWEEAISTLAEQEPPLPLLAQRKTYYQAAMDFSLKSSQPMGTLWPLLITWTEAITSLPNQIQLRAEWIKALTSLGFAGKDYQVKLAAFDSFLEMCETLVIGEHSEAEEH